jgi:hypothetical protein
MSSVCRLRVRRWLQFALLLVAVAGLPAFADPQGSIASLSYRLQPVLAHGTLEALDMRMAFDMPPSGVIRIKPPQGIGQDAPSRKVTVTGVHAGTLDTAPDGTWAVHAGAGKHVVLDYRIALSADAASPGGSGYQDVLMGRTGSRVWAKTCSRIPAATRRPSCDSNGKVRRHGRS